MTASSPRHEMEMHVRLGAMNDGTIRAIDLYTLSNTGAYGEHGPTTVVYQATNRFLCTENVKRSNSVMM